LLCTFCPILGTLALATLLLLQAVATPPAGAAGIETLCGGVGGGSGGPSFPRLEVRGDARTGERHGPVVIPNPTVSNVEADGTPDFAPGNLVPIHLDAPATGADLQVGLGLRVSTAAETDLTESSTGATPLDALFNTNYGITDNFNPPSLRAVLIGGIDVLVKLPPKSVIRQTAAGQYATAITTRVGFPMADKTTRYFDLQLRIDALQAAARDPRATFPDEVRFTVALFPLFGTTSHWTVGQEVVYAGRNANDVPPLDIGVALTEVGATPEAPSSGTKLFDTTMAWDRAPADFAIGVRQTCNVPVDQSFAHFAANLPSPATAGHAVDVRVRSGLGRGVDGGDQLRLEGTIDRVPSQVDVLERPNAFDVTRSPGAPPTLVLDRLDLGRDTKSAGSDNQPIHAYGRIDALPAHVRVGVERDPTNGDVSSVAIDACPTIAPGDPMALLLPSAAKAPAAGRFGTCVKDAVPQTRIASAHLVVQNFLPDGRNGGVPSAGLPAIPATPRPAAVDRCRYEARTDGPWVRACTHLPSVRRTAFVYAAAQHPRNHLNSTTDVNTLLVRAGAGLLDVGSVRLETRAGSRLPDGIAPTPTDRETWGARDRVAIALDAGAEPSAGFVAHFDRRTDTQRVSQNRGALTHAQGSVAPLPRIDELAFDTLGRGTQHHQHDEATQLTWRLHAPVTVRVSDLELRTPWLGAAGAQLPGLEVDAQAEATVPATGTFRLDERLVDDVESTSLVYTPVPDTSTTGLKVAGVVSTRSERATGRWLALDGAATLHSPLTARLDRKVGDGTLAAVQVNACTTPTRCDNSVELDAAYGNRAVPPTLATGVTLAPPPKPVAWIQPPATAPNNVALDLTANNDRWTASVRAVDVVGVNATPPTGDVCFRTASTEPASAVLSRPDLYIGGALSHLPASTHIRFQGAPAPGQPMLWVDTTGCTLTAPPIASTSPGAAPGSDDPVGRPVLDATIVAGSGNALQALRIPPATPTGTTDSVTATLERAADGNTAVAAKVRERVPDHLMLWPPVVKGCGDAGITQLAPASFGCAAPKWEPGAANAVEVRLQSTRRDLGRLRVIAHLAPPANAPATPVLPRPDLTIDATVPQLPGSFRVSSSLASNSRVPWTDAFVQAVAPIPIGDLSVDVTDASPASTAFAGDAVGTRSAVPKYRLRLHEIASDLTVVARLRGSENPQHNPRPDPCPGHAVTSRGPQDIGYVHADVDLDGLSGSARNIAVDFVSALDDPRAQDQPAQLATINADKPIDATVQARLVNVVLGQQVTIQFDHWLAHSVNVTADACLDLDLPFELTLDDTKTVRFANEGAVFALDTDTAAPATATMRVGEPTPGGFRFGAPYNYRSVRVDPDISEPVGQTVATPAWKDAPAVPLAPDCVTAPYSPGNPAVSTAGGPTSTFSAPIADTAGNTTTTPLNRTSFALDLLVDAAFRTSLATNMCDVGALFYGQLAGTGSPPVSLPVPRFVPQAVKNASATIRQADLGAAGDFCTTRGWNTAAEDRSSGTGPDYPVAVGADGTRYSLNVWTNAGNHESCHVTLVARHAGGGIRWARPFAAWLLPLPQRGQADWRFVIMPDAGDGSVEVHLRQTDLVRPGNTKEYTARLDAGGRGEIRQTAGPFATPTGVVRVPVTSAALPGTCLSFALNAGAVAPPGVVRVWYFGDGTERTDGTPTPNHCYRSRGRYYVQAVDYRDGVVIGSARWSLTLV
jgi:hypothetical protein